MSLQLQIGADVSGAVKGVDILHKQLDRLQKIASLPGLSFSQIDRLNKMLLSTQNQINSFNRAAALTSPALQKTTSSSQSATFALTNLSRVAQDLPYGFLGIANNLNPLLESFQRLKAETGSSREAFKSLGASLMGAGGIGLALGVVSSLLVVFGDRLFGAKSRADESKQALDALNSTLAEQKSRIDDLTSSLTFLNKINKIGIQINFDKGGDALGLRGELVSGGNILNQIEEELALNQTLIDNLHKRNIAQEVSEKDFNQQLETLTNHRREIYRKQGKLEEEQIEKRALLRLQNKKDSDAEADEQKKLLEERLRDWETYVSKTIARGKELANYFEGQGTRKVPLFSVFDTRGEEFKKALDFINEVDIGEVRIIFNPDFDMTKFKDSFTGKLRELLKENPLSDIGQVGDRSKPGGAFLDAQRRTQRAIQATREELEKTIQVGQYFGNVLASAFGQAFDSVAQGENVFKAIGQAIKQLVMDLIKAAIQAFIVKSIINLMLPGAGTVGLGGIGALIGGLPRRAAGGPMAANKMHLVGENGPELFVSSSHGRIEPNTNRISGSAMQMVQVLVQGRIQGQDLVLVQARETRRQGRY